MSKTYMKKDWKKSSVQKTGEGVKGFFEKAADKLTGKGPKTDQKGGKNSDKSTKNKGK